MKGIRKTTQPREKATLPASTKRLPVATLSTMKRMLHTKKSTQIERIEIIDDLITLSGAEPESENHKDKFGWIITIVKGTGQMVLSANSNNSAFVIFGSCAHM